MRGRATLSRLPEVLIYLAIGFGLLAAVVWYGRSVGLAIRGEAEVTVVPFQMTGSSGDEAKRKGTMLARLLLTELAEIDRVLATSQDELQKTGVSDMDDATRTSGAPTDEPVPLIQDAGGTETPAGSASTSVTEPAIEPADRRSTVWNGLFTSRQVGITMTVLAPTDLTLKVGGVELSGVVAWLQQRLARRHSLEFTVDEGATKVTIAGDLEALGIHKPLRVVVPKLDGYVDLQDISAAVAYEIACQRLSGTSHGLEDIGRERFQTLVEVIREVAQLNRSLAMRRPVRPAFAKQLQRISPITHDFSDWYQLNAFAASIARSAGDNEQELTLQRNVAAAIEREARVPGATRKELDDARKLAVARISLLTEAVKSAGGMIDANALKKIQDDANAAAEAFGPLFGVKLAPPPVKLLSRDEHQAYYDGQTYYADPLVAQMPEITQHNVSWPFINSIIPLFGNPLSSVSPEANAILYSYSDVLPMVLKHKAAANADWTLYAGAVSWLKGADAKTIADDHRPLRSFAAPGTAYDDKEIGKDRQLASVQQLDTSTEQHAASGIGNKAFFEVAKQLGVEKAWKIWLDALTRSKTRGRALSYRTWAKDLLAASGDAREATAAALRAVGLGVSNVSTP
jgi:hypothetical protein